LELLPPTPRGPTKAIRPAKLSPDHWIRCRHTPEWSGSCRGHMASKATTRTPPPACRHHLRSTALHRLRHSRTYPTLPRSTICVRSHRCGTAVAGPNHHHQVQPPCATRREGEQPRPLDLPGCPHSLPRSICHAASTNQLPPSAITASTTTNGLPGCPHTLHPPRRLHHPAATEGDRRADQPLQPEGETEEGGAAEANGGPPRLLSHPPCRHHHPTCRRVWLQSRQIRPPCAAHRWIQPPHAARCRLTAEEDEPQPDLQARCPTGAV
jgi:hypothetical protein